MSSRQLQKAIENPTLELKIVSASEVSHTDVTDKMDVYAVVSINGDDTTQPKQAAKTPIDYDGGSNPTWNHTVKFSINEREANEGLLNIKVELFSYWLEGKDDLYLGEVNVSVQELLASTPFANGNVNKMKPLTCPIKVTEGGSTKATMSLLYRFKSVPVEESCLPAPDNSPSIGQPVYSKPDQAISGQPVVFSPRFQSSTAKLILQVVIKYAKDIEDVNALSVMDVYASVAILKDRKVKDRINTPIAIFANTNPKWNQAMKFCLDEKLAQEGRLTLLVELMSHRPILGDKEIGFVRLPIKQLLSSNPPTSLTNGDANGMRLETHALTGPYGLKGVVTFTYRFLAEQVTVSTVPQPSTTSQPYIMYLPVSPHSYASSDPIQVTSSYMTVQPGGSNAGPSNGLVPIYMPPTYRSHGYQQYSPRHPLPQPQQHSQHKPLPQQPFPQALQDTQEA
uniref:C2 domain-containing protein n=1 Tax=Noccaea caerulescens TaxID=107243 RepID=A0A1J3F3G4_NOCCA